MLLLFVNCFLGRPKETFDDLFRWHIATHNLRSYCVSIACKDTAFFYIACNRLPVSCIFFCVIVYKSTQAYF
ncbi:MAG TPA: hypothetical protein DIW30_06875 [Bacteroidales bacterium]|nr:hypothetical protein [Bacteroidales bacterium]